MTLPALFSIGFKAAGGGAYGDGLGLALDDVRTAQNHHREVQRGGIADDGVPVFIRQGDGRAGGAVSHAQRDHALFGAAEGLGHAGGPGADKGAAVDDAAALIV